MADKNIKQPMGYAQRFSDDGSGNITPYGLPLPASSASAASVNASASSVTLKAANSVVDG